MSTHTLRCDDLSRRPYPCFDMAGRFTFVWVKSGVDGCGGCRQAASYIEAAAKEHSRYPGVSVQRAFDKCLLRVSSEILAYNRLQAGNYQMYEYVEEITDQDIATLLQLLINQKRNSQLFIDRFYYMGGQLAEEHQLDELAATLTYWRYAMAHPTNRLHTAGLLAARKLRDEAEAKRRVQ